MPTFSTFVQAIETASTVDPARGYRFVSDQGVPGFDAGVPAESSFSYAALERASARYGGALQALGLRKGDRVALILPTNEDFVLCFLGAVRAGIVPVPIYPPLGLGQLQGYLDNTRHIVGKSGARALVTSATIKRLLGTVQEHCPSLEAVVAVEAIRESQEPLAATKIDPSDVVFLQFTSGSTSRPKGVSVTHANLMANIHCIMEVGLRINETDVGISWLPLYHDMGLIGFMLAPLVHRVPIVFMPPFLFLRRPVTWFQTITRHKGTIAYAPNFAFALCSKRVRERDLGGLELSTWRVAGCGAEPIRPETLQTFCDSFGKIGFRQEALLPSYGMAESSLAIAFSGLERGMRATTFDGDRLFGESLAIPAPDDAESAVRLVSCGPSFPGHEIAIFPPADADGTSPTLPEGQVGEIRITGPRVLHGYWEDAERTKDAFAGDWLRTGDLGFFHGGELFICGRSKEVIIINGRNYYPQDLEWEASRVPGVRKGNVIAFGTHDASGEREKVVLAFEVQDVAVAPEQAKAHGQSVAALVRKAVQEGTGLTLDDVVPLAAGALPKTSSGKLQRTRTRELYDVGELTTRRSAREKDRLDLVKEAAKSQLSYFKLAVLGARKRK